MKKLILLVLLIGFFATAFSQSGIFKYRRNVHTGKMDMYYDQKAYIDAQGGGSGYWTLTGNQLSPDGAYTVSINDNDSLKIDTIAVIYNENGSAVDIQAIDANFNFDITSNGTLDLTHHYGFGWLNAGASNMTFEVDSDTNSIITMKTQGTLDGWDNKQIIIKSGKTGHSFGAYNSTLGISCDGNMTLNPNRITSGNRVDIDGELRVGANYNFVVLGTGVTNLHNNTIRVDGSSNEVGINDATPEYTLDNNGDFRTVEETYLDSTLFMAYLPLMDGDTFLVMSNDSIGYKIMQINESANGDTTIVYNIFKIKKDIYAVSAIFDSLFLQDLPIRTTIDTALGWSNDTVYKVPVSSFGGSGDGVFDLHSGGESATTVTGLDTINIGTGTDDNGMLRIWKELDQTWKKLWIDPSGNLSAYSTTGNAMTFGAYNSAYAPTIYYSGASGTTAGYRFGKTTTSNTGWAGYEGTPTGAYMNAMINNVSRMWIGQNGVHFGNDPGSTTWSLAVEENHTAYFGGNILQDAGHTLHIGGTVNNGYALEVEGTSRLDVHVHTPGTIADNDATPDVGTTPADVWTYNGTANSVTITDLDNPVVNAEYWIIGNSDTYTVTISDGGNFNLGAASRVLGVDDVLILYVQADNDYIEINFIDN